MPPPRGSFNPIEGPGDYDMTSTVHNDTYAAIDPTRFDMTGKAVFICGASRGLGRAMAISFARAGASYIAVGARSDVSTTVQMVRDAAAARTSTQNSSTSPKVLPVQIDMTSQASVAAAADLISAEFGRLDILLNNAALLNMETIRDGDPEAWVNLLVANVGGPYRVSKAMLPLLLKSEGGSKTIVTTSSVGAHCVTPTLSAYQTSKLAVTRFTEFLAAELGDAEGVLTYTIHPGNIPTDVVGGLEGLDPTWRHIFVETPELSADSLVYLTSERRTWLNGRYINVTWDLPELMGKQDEIVAGDKLKVRLVL